MGIAVDLAQKLQLRDFSLEALAQELQLRNFSLMTLAQELQLRNFSLETLAQELQLRNFGLGALAQSLQLRLGESGKSGRGNQLDGARGIGRSRGQSQPFKILSKNPSRKAQLEKIVLLGGEQQQRLSLMNKGMFLGAQIGSGKEAETRFRISTLVTGCGSWWGALFPDGVWMRQSAHPNDEKSV